MKKPDAFRERREDMLLRYLVRLTRAMTVETVERMNAVGHREITPAHPRLLGNLDTEGTRIAALARKMGTSRQAVSQMLHEVEAKGFVERHPDPDDKRGVIVRFTPQGRKMLGDAVEVMTGIEREYREVLGDRDYPRFKQMMKKLLDRIDPQGELGLD